MPRNRARSVLVLAAAPLCLRDKHTHDNRLSQGKQRESQGSLSASPSPPQGFTDPRIYKRRTMDVLNPAIAAATGNARFESITLRLFKLPRGRLETTQEDFGQVAVYKGTVELSAAAYVLDLEHKFEKARCDELGG